MTGNRAPTAGGYTPAPPQKKAWVLRSYPEYKESGVEWLGQVPKHWNVMAGRACYYEKKLPNTGLKETTVLSLSYGKIVVKSADKLHGLVPESFETYQIIEPGDIVIRPTDLQNDWNSLRFGLSHNRGIITSAYLCFRTKEPIDRNYGHLLLHTYDLKKVFYGLGSGLRQNLDWRDFKYLPCVVPLLSEQSAIVKFLENADRRIRHFIHAKSRLIDLLIEQKQAIINHAVMRGIDPNVRLKPSGIEWLGNVPEHWRIAKLSGLTTSIGDGLHGTPEYVEDSSLYFINGNNLSNGSVKITSSTSCVSIGEFQKYKTPLDETTLLLSINGTIGSVSLYQGESIILGKSVAYINCKEDLFRNYLFYLLQSTTVNNFLKQEATGTIIFNLSLASIRNLHIPLPSFSEQQEISAILDTKIAMFHELIDKAFREITLIREYQIHLISDVVTGKVDVRNIEIQEEMAVDSEDIGDIDVLDENGDDNNDDDDGDDDEANDK